jgi:hypothetical protein
MSYICVKRPHPSPLMVFAVGSSDAIDLTHSQRQPPPNPECTNKASPLCQRGRVIGRRTTVHLSLPKCRAGQGPSLRFFQHNISSSLPRRNGRGNRHAVVPRTRFLALVVVLDNLLNMAETLFLARRGFDVVQGIWRTDDYGVVNDDVVAGPARRHAGTQDTR